MDQEGQIGRDPQPLSESARTARNMGEIMTALKAKYTDRAVPAGTDPKQFQKVSSEGEPIVEKRVSDGAIIAFLTRTPIGSEDEGRIRFTDDEDPELAPGYDYNLNIGTHSDLDTLDAARALKAAEPWRSFSNTEYYFKKTGECLKFSRISKKLLNGQEVLRDLGDDAIIASIMNAGDYEKISVALATINDQCLGGSVTIT